MTDLFTYHLAKDQLTDLRRTSGETRLVSTVRCNGALPNRRTLVGSLLTHLPAAVGIGRQKPPGASHAATNAPDSLTNPAREIS